MRLPALGLLAACGAACGDPAARVSLVPVGGGACGAPPGATGLVVTAFGAGSDVSRAIALDQTLAIDDFPADTIALGVDLIGASGAEAAIGKTAPLAFDDLADGATIPIFMAPPDGACALPDLLAGRTRPLVARAGDEVLIAGGEGSGVTATAELYDPATATFAAIDLPASLIAAPDGLRGGVLTALPDGRVALTGTSRGILSIFDPATRAFGELQVSEARVFHSAIAVDAGHLLFAGGCMQLDETTGDCGSGSAGRANVEHAADLIALADPGTGVSGAVLPMADDPRVDGALIDLGPRAADGKEAYAFASGEPEPGRIAIFAFSDPNTANVALPAQVVGLDGGALLAAFGSDGDLPTGAAAILAPGAGSGTPITSAPVAEGARLVALEDGRALAIGGTSDGSVASYDPTVDAWTAHVPGGDSPGALVAPTLLRLADGSVLVLSAPAAAGDPSHAWIYRPSIVGPEVGHIDALPDGSTGVLTAPDPTRVARTPRAQILTAPAADDPALPARLIVGGPRTATGVIAASVTPGSGSGPDPTSGVALIAEQLGPGRALIARLVPGQAATITRVDALHAGGATCTGTVVDAFTGSTVVALAVRDHVATVTRDEAPLLTCSLDGDPDVDDVGAWGVAAAGPGAVLSVGNVTVDR